MRRPSLAQRVRHTARWVAMLGAPPASAIALLPWIHGQGAPPPLSLAGLAALACVAAIDALAR